MNIAIRVKPSASSNAVGGAYPGPYGEALIVAVTAPAVDGRANDAVIKAVAGALGLRPAAIRVRTGATARNKILEVADPAPETAATLARLLRGRP